MIGAISLDLFAFERQVFLSTRHQRARSFEYILLATIYNSVFARDVSLAIDNV